MKEIRIHGRGGQGGVTAAQVLAVAAFKDGKYSQAFPHFGVERRGAPVMAFARLSDKFIRLKQQVYEPDYLIILDPTLISAVDVTAGLKGDGKVVINSKEPIKLDTKARIYTVDATTIALETLKRPIVNTATLGAFAKATGEVSLDSILSTLEGRFKGPVLEANQAAVKRAYKEVKEA